MRFPSLMIGFKENLERVDGKTQSLPTPSILLAYILRLSPSIGIIVYKKNGNGDALEIKLLYREITAVRFLFD